jgi:2-(1,2-epoxy-1,2-dihydrophenyl)acetyl-CoA isomerase
MSAYEAIRYETFGHRATVTLNRPEARNGITQQMLDELYDALKHATGDKALRALVLRGEGADFCPGADLKHYASGKGGRSNPQAFHVSSLLHEAPFVTIAAIRGACAGAGLGWAAACDLRVCDDSAKFNSAFLGVGISGDMGGPWTLSRILGAAKARELYFLPGKFGADEAERIGLVNRRWSAAAFEDELDALVLRFVNAAPIALRSMKANFLDAEHMSLRDFIDAETRRHGESGATEDSREAFKAFVEKRTPVFHGR